MRLIDGDVLVMLLTDWWYASFGQTETQESKAIKAVLDQVKIHVEKHECKPCEVGTQMSLPLCEDAISRQAAIDAIDKIFPADPMKNDYTQGIACGAALATEYIRQLPPAQPEQRWIPITERPPKKGQKCLVSDKGRIAIDTFWGRGGAYNWQFYVRDYEAWMPLVQPYKEEKE